MRYVRTKRLKQERKKKECDRCGFDYAEEDLVEQRGLMVCKTCYDEEPSYGDDDE